jgi:EAL domain-containing protein (putative c-di-GMP-specific phosphodiesterase class I)
VLKRACETALHWPDNIQVAVNLSPLQFTSGDAVEAIEDAIRLSGLPPKRLQIEITESTLLDRSDLILRDLNRIKALGVSIAMDDFGTGYSSLSYLWKFPFDKIKVDRSFVTNIGPQQSDARTLLHTIISLGHSLSMTVTVEGVETAEQARAMSELECDQVQGYHYGKPIPEPSLPSFLLQNLIHNMVPDLTESTGENLLASSEVDRLNLLH